MQGRKPIEQYESVKDFVERTGMKKGFVADRWGISRFQMTALIYPGRYPVSLTDAQVKLIAQDLNKPADHVRKLYAA